jgi:hypothetical protein
MAEEVKIVDVAGGPASEATLAELLKTMKLMSGGGSSDTKGAKAQKKAQELYTDSTNRGTKANKRETKATQQATKALGGFSRGLSSGLGSIIGGFANLGMSIVNMGMVFTTSANTIGEFASTVPVVGGIFGSLAGYFQDGVDTFRQLSQNGASFNNNLIELRLAAAQANLPLDVFASAVQNNANTLTLLGGTISEGAKRLGALSKTAREAGFLELGFTISELTDLSAAYIEQQSRQGRLEARGSKAEADGLTAYIGQLDKLTRITGMSRKQVEEQLLAQANDAQTQAMLSKMGEKEKIKYEANLATLSSLGPALYEGFKDLADGTPQKEMAVQMASMSPAFGKFAENMKNMSPEEFQTELKKLGGPLAAFRDQMGGTFADIPGHPFADLFNEIGNLQKYADKTIDFEELAREKARRDKITDAFTNFENKVNEIKNSLSIAFIDSGVLTVIGTGLQGLADIFVTAGEEIDEKTGEKVKTLQFTDAMTNLKVKIEEITETIKTFIKDIANPDVSFSEALKKLFKGDGKDGKKIDVGKMLGEAVAAAWENIDLNIPWGALFVGGLAGIGAAIAAPVLAVPAGIAVAITAFFGAQALKNLVSGAWDLLVAGFTFGADVVSSLTSGIGGLFTSAWETVKGWLSFGPDNTFSISALGTKAWETVTGWFGLTGLDFSISALGTVAWEAVKTWFSFGTEVAYSIGSLALTAWNTVTGWFGFGEGEAAYSIGTLATSAWNTVTGWFGFGDMEMPSIKSMFQTVIDKVKGFFTFDFKMPNFKSFLPKWMGGEGKTLSDAGDAAGTGVTTQMAVAQAPSVSMPTETGSALSNLATVSYATLNAELMNLKSNMDNIGKIDGFKTTIASLNELDKGGVSKYNDAVKDLNETFKDLNKTLSEDNKGLFGGGTGVASADVLKSQAMSGNSNNELNTTMQLLLAEMKQVNENTGSKLPKAIRETGTAHS